LLKRKLDSFFGRSAGEVVPGKPATFAGQSSRTFKAIAARFDPELLQYDAANEIVSARLEDLITIFKLNKALRQSPLL
jgi:hypothetical protein